MRFLLSDMRYNRMKKIPIPGTKQRLSESAGKSSDGVLYPIATLTVPAALLYTTIIENFARNLCPKVRTGESGI